MRACVMVLVLVDVCMLQLLLSYFVIVFKQRTAYEKRMSDWRSDVCSSDLLVRGVDTVDIKAGVGFGKAKPLRLFQHLVKGTPGSEERRVGKECVSTCRSRGSPDQ